MDNFSKKKEAYIERIAGYILQNGINESSLKKMADAALTSDRMLMHYFKDKEEILNLTLMQISQDFISLLNSDPQLKLGFDEFVIFLGEAIKDNRVRPYLNLWLELIHLASNGKDPYFAVSKKIGETYWGWLLQVYRPAVNEDKNRMAALIYALTEGFVFLDKIDMGDKIDLALEAILFLYKRRESV